jgi:hypothetical protein
MRFDPYAKKSTEGGRPRSAISVRIFHPVVCKKSLSVLFIHPDGLGPVFPVDESHGSSCFPPLVAMVEAADPR